IPFIGPARPKVPARTPRGVVLGAITVADPAVTGNSQYRFSARIAPNGTPADVTILVEPDPTGYAIRVT
ncbi:hypothetical protein ACFQ07_02665, partial [Actinomadura adrarensis]